MSVLGIDWGERKLGFAISHDPAWAFPLRALRVRGFTDAIEQIQAIVIEEKVDCIALGLPLGMDGKDTLQTSRVREIAADLGGIVNVPVELIDERLTTQTAVRQREDQTAKVPDDLGAAVAILQTYLNLHQPV